MSAVTAAAALAFAPLVQAQQLRPDAPPATGAQIAASPAVKRLKELLEVVNGGDAARIKAWVQTAAAQPGPVPVAVTLDLYHRSRGLDLVRVEKVEGNVIVAVLRNRLTGTCMPVTAKILQVLQPARPPAA